MGAKKGTENKKNKRGIKYREIVGILLLAISIFSVLALYTDTAGLVGVSLRKILRVSFGDLAIVYAILATFLALHIFRGKTWPPPLKRIFGLSLLLLSLTLFFHMLYYRGYQFPPKLLEEINYGKKGEGAGVAGAVLLVLSYNSFGIEGSYILVGTAVLIGIIFFFQISLLDLLTSLKGRAVQAVRLKWAGFLDSMREKIERRKIKRLAKKEVQQSNPAKAAKRKTVKKKAKQPAQAKEARKEPQTAKSPNAPLEENKAVEKVAKEDKAEPFVLTLPNKAGSGGYKLPPTYLLKKSSVRSKRGQDAQQELLEKTFASFGIEAKVVNVSQGPVVTRYELQPAPGIKVSRITALADDLALALAAENVRIEAPVPGKPVVGIEVPNKDTEPVLLRDVLESSEFAEHPSPVALALGKDIAGKPVIADLKKWLHLLVAGATGSGKSVCLNAIIASLLFRTNPDDVKLLMIDPKRVELSVYNGIPHLISPVVTDPRKAATALRWAVVEMERRYQLFAEAGVRNIDMYLEQRATSSPAAEGDETEDKLEHLPYIVIIVDELADLMMIAAAEVEDAICRLAQMARAAGMYLIIATQRPSVDVITGLIKANVPSRIAFAVSSQVDSRTILDMGGAERLIGRGDMLYYPIGASKPVRAQGAWISYQEVESLVQYWKKQGEPEYEESIQKADAIDQALGDNEIDEDELLPDAIRLVVENGQASISMLQRRFRIGYSRAARLIDAMEVRGIVGSHQGSKPRDVLVDSTILEEGE